MNISYSMNGRHWFRQHADDSQQIPAVGEIIRVGGWCDGKVKQIERLYSEEGDVVRLRGVMVHCKELKAPFWSPEGVKP